MNEFGRGCLLRECNGVGRVIGGRVVVSGGRDGIYLGRREGKSADR